LTNCPAACKSVFVVLELSASGEIGVVARAPDPGRDASIFVAENVIALIDCDATGGSPPRLAPLLSRAVDNGFHDERYYLK
jgi:hypothetical protein